MGVRLNRHLGPSAGLDAAQWCLEAGEVYVCCPICMAVLRLDGRHVVARDGNVTPALACHACQFLDWVELSGLEDDDACIGCARAIRSVEVSCSVHGRR